jgi:hypothetical protein
MAQLPRAWPLQPRSWRGEMDATGYTMQIPRRIRSDDWLEQDGEVVLRESCMMLLEVVELTGSISVATTYP